MNLTIYVIHARIKYSAGPRGVRERVLYVYIYMCVDIHACIHTYIHTYVHTYIYIYVYIYVYIFTYIYIYIYNSAGPRGVRKRAEEWPSGRGGGCGDFQADCVCYWTLPQTVRGAQVNKKQFKQNRL